MRRADSGSSVASFVIDKNPLKNYNIRTGDFIELKRKTPTFTTAQPIGRHTSMAAAVEATMDNISLVVGFTGMNRIDFDIA